MVSQASSLQCRPLLHKLDFSEVFTNQAVKPPCTMYLHKTWKRYTNCHLDTAALLTWKKSSERSHEVCTTSHHHLKTRILNVFRKLLPVATEAATSWSMSRESLIQAFSRHIPEASQAGMLLTTIHYMKINCIYLIEMMAISNKRSLP